MFEIYSKDYLIIKTSKYSEIKLYEASCRGQKKDYKITYPDGTQLECKFYN